MGRKKPVKVRFIKGKSCKHYLTEPTRTFAVHDAKEIKKRGYSAHIFERKNYRTNPRNGKRFSFMSYDIYKCPVSRTVRRK